MSLEITAQVLRGATSWLFKAGKCHPWEREIYDLPEAEPSGHSSFTPGKDHLRMFSESPGGLISRVIGEMENTPIVFALFSAPPPDGPTQSQLLCMATPWSTAGYNSHQWAA